MSVEENTKKIVEPRNVDWQVMPDPDGKFPEAQVTHSLLMDIRENTRSMRKMMVFFTVLAVVDCIVLALWLVVHALG